MGKWEPDDVITLVLLVLLVGGMLAMGIVAVFESC